MDDEPLVLHALGRELAGAFELLTAGGPDEAILLIDSVNLTALVTDLNMLGDEEAGMRVLRHVAARQPSCARVLLSGSLFAASLAAGLAHATFGKPWRSGAVRADLLERAGASP